MRARRHGRRLILALATVTSCFFPDVSPFTGPDAAGPPDVATTDATDGAPDAGCGPIARISTQLAPDPGTRIASTNVTISTTTGDLLVAVIAGQFPGTLTLSDTAGTTWTALPEQNNASCVTDAAPWATRVQIQYGLAVQTTPGDVVTLATTSTDYLVLDVSEYASTHALAFDTNTGMTAPASSAVLTSGPITLSACTSLVVAMFGDEYPGNATYGLSTGYAKVASSANWSYAIADAVGLEAGVVDPTATLNDSDSCWAVVAAVFK